MTLTGIWEVIKPGMDTGIRLYLRVLAPSQGSAENQLCAERIPCLNITITIVSML